MPATTPRHRPTPVRHATRRRAAATDDRRQGAAGDRRGHLRRRAARCPPAKGAAIVATLRLRWRSRGARRHRIDRQGGVPPRRGHGHQPAADVGRRRGSDDQPQAERSIAAFVRHRDRMVAADDFDDVVRQTPGVDLGRVEVLPLVHPDLPGQQLPGRGDTAADPAARPGHARRARARPVLPAGGLRPRRGPSPADDRAPPARPGLRAGLGLDRDRRDAGPGDRPGPRGGQGRGACVPVAADTAGTARPAGRCSRRSAGSS